MFSLPAYTRLTNHGSLIKVEIKRCTMKFLTSHFGQLHIPSGTSSSGGSRQVKCHEQVHVSHNRMSPPSAQTSQTELCTGVGGLSAGSPFLFPPRSRGKYLYQV